MKILTLNLKAFGPFTEKTLDFSKENFHIIYGPNEAGKSSALRAITQFLYGIPARSSDDFIHRYQEMLIGATLEASDGRKATFFRRKGNRNTLLDSEQNPCPDSALNPFLNHVSEALFKSMFGLDHQLLIEGGKELLSSESDVGESIFSAGMGLVGLRKLLNDLAGKEKDLFRPAGSKPVINRLLSSLTQIRTDLNQVSLSASTFKEKERELQQANQKKTDLENRQQDLVNRRAHFERLSKAAPKIAALDSLKEERNQLGRLPALSSDFSEKRKRNQWARQEISRKIETLREEIAKINGETEKIGLEPKILEQEARILNLFQRESSWLECSAQLPVLEIDRKNLQEETRELLRNLELPDDLDHAEKLRLSEPKRDFIALTFDSLKSVRRELADSGKALAKLRSEIAETGKNIDKLPPNRSISPLNALIQKATEEGNLIRRKREISTDLKQMEDEAQLLIHKLFPESPPTLDLVATLPIPKDPTIREFGSEQSQLLNDQKDWKKRIEECEKEQRKIEKRIASLKQDGAISTEPDLSEARTHRDRGWDLVRRCWKGSEVSDEEIHVFTNGNDLAGTYEMSVKTADEIADRLRRESDRVAELKELESRLQETKSKIADFRQKSTETAETLADWENRWNELWKPFGIIPQSPEAMSAWRQEFSALCDQTTSIRRLRMDHKVLTDRILELEKEFLNLGNENDFPLLKEPAALDNLILGAQETVERIQAENLKRRELETAREKAKKEFQNEEQEQQLLQTEEQKQQENWLKAAAYLALDPEQVTVDHAETVFKRLDHVFKNLDDIADLDRQVQHFQQQCRIYERDLRELLKDLEEAAPSDLANVAPKLHSRLTNSQRNQEKLEALRRQIAQKETGLAAAETQKTTLGRELEQLLQEAEVDDESKLAGIEEAVQRARAIDTKISDQTDHLHDFSDGRPVEELIDEVRQIDVSTLPGEIELLKTREIELQEELNQINQEIGKFRTEISAHDGNEQAALKAEERESVLAELRTQLEEYGRIRLAILLLNKEIERYRLKHQGPVLQAASRFFRKLTLDSFSGLVTDFDSADHQILVGLRPDGSRVTVEGMSEGTCDQLYLALRLASLQHHAESNEPMPLILDDILVNFDDDRSQAAIEVLVELSERNQIIYFTHHRHLIDIAQKLPGSSRISFHNLERAFGETPDPDLPETEETLPATF